MKKIFVLMTLLISTFIMSNCSHYDELQKHGDESTHGSSESHEYGKDCMVCHHVKGSEAEREGGWWNIAGSVYDEINDQPFTDGVIELWSQPDREGVLYYSLPIDALGNFYTEKVVQFNGTCFPVVVNNLTGEYESMERAYHSGGCNSCHGQTEELISVDE